MNERRKRIVSYKKIQFGLAKRIMLHWAILFMTSFCLLTIWQLLVSGDPYNLFSDHMKMMWVRMIPIFVVFLTLLPVFIYDTVKFSNKFTGPVYRLQKTIQSLADGDVANQIKFRKKDFWHDLADDFNELLEKADADSYKELDSGSEKETSGSV